MWLKQPTELTARFRISERDASRLRCTAEHLLARQDGGTNSGENIVAACTHCNKTRHRIKSQPDPIRYREHVSRRIRVGKWHPKNVRNLMELIT
jgi:5-methylcytosine-specific restriction endonuclease McrA